MIDYRNGVNEITPNQIYKNVFVDNQKFEFENDIYSTEFFDFVKGILNAVYVLSEFQTEESALMDSVKENALLIAKKAILELLCKCFYN
jgi:hypothetical protein